jgi:CheY-like chemotaxis protein
MSPSYPVVLLVDDNELTRGATAAYLSAQGLAVIAVNSAQAALDVLQNKRVNAVVSDFEMPKMDGLQLAAAVHKSYPTLPFFIMSGREAPLEADPAPFAGWVQKGSSLTKLRDELLLRLAGETTEPK